MPQHWWKKDAQGNKVKILAASTGNSSMAKVLENLEVYGNENAITGRRIAFVAVEERYSKEIARLRKANAKKYPLAYPKAAKKLSKKSQKQNQKIVGELLDLLTQLKI